MKELQGQLLVASVRLVDPNFLRTVILVVQHDENGALGLVINRPLETTVKEACEATAELATEIESALYQGGPCEGPLMVVHTDSETSQRQVLAGVHFTTDRDHIEMLLQMGGGRKRFFVNYAGWGPGQLEAEMEAGSWLTVEASDEKIFGESAPQWSQLMTEVTVGRWIDPSRIPDDPSVN